MAHEQKYFLDVPESELSHKDRLGLAYCRLNSFEWDELFGEKPDGFDELPRYHNYKWWERPFGKKVKTKHDYTHPCYLAVKSALTEKETSFYWHKFVLGRTNEEFEKWWNVDRVLFEAQAYAEEKR